MMKLNNINFCTLVVLIACLFVSCDSDKVVDQITGSEQRGAVLRQTTVIANSVALNSETGLLEDGERFAVDLEYQDDADGSLLSEMEVYLSFADNTDDAVDNSQSEILFESVPASSFTGGDRGFPIFSYSLGADEMLTALGMTVDQLGTGGDQFAVRFEVVLNDGRRFSSDDNSGTITGSYFASPFRNLVTVVCAPTVPTSGTWVVVTDDSFGDSWNGASLSILIDGTNMISIEHLFAGGDYTPNMPQTFEFEVPDGTRTISITYVAGDFDAENTVTVTSANGNEVINESAPPRSGVELLDFCAGGL